jgi:uncharacterized protein (TIGR00251 family)
MIEIRESRKGLIFPVRVQPKASANRILGEHNGALKIGVTAVPEKGKANAAVISLLSKELCVPKSAVEIVGGETSRLKTLRIHGLTRESLLARLNSALEREGKSGV